MSLIKIYFSVNKPLPKKPKNQTNRKKGGKKPKTNNNNEKKTNPKINNNKELCLRFQDFVLNEKPSSRGVWFLRRNGITPIWLPCCSSLAEGITAAETPNCSHTLKGVAWSHH